MHVNFLIATFDRYKTLTMTIDSIFNGTFKDISLHLIVDGNSEMLKRIKQFCKGRDYEVNFYNNKERKDVIFSFNKVLKHINGGSVLFATDDLLFHPDCLITALRAMKKMFNGSDGIVGLNQLQRGEPKGRKYAFGLIGEDFVKRFPDNQIFCPDYIHFNGDRELGIYSKSIDKLFYCEQAQVDHIRLQDNTTALGKQVYMRDKLIFKERQQKGFLWGKNFHRIEP